MSESESCQVFYKGGAKRWDKKTDAEQCLGLIEEHSELRSLTINDLSMSVEAAEALGSILKSKPSLKLLDLRDIFTGRLRNEVPEATRLILTATLDAGADIESFDMSDNAFGPNGLVGLTSFLSKSKKLKSIKLINNGIGAAGTKMVCDSLIERIDAQAEDFSLEEIEFGRNRIVAEGAAEFASFLQKFTTLKKFCIPHNGIPAEGFLDLFEALRKHPELTELDFEGNVIKGKALELLCVLISDLKNLTVLNISDCLLKNEGGRKICEIIRNIKCPLKVLGLNYNEFNLDTGMEIIDAVKASQCELKLSLNGNYFSEAGIEKLAELVGSKIALDGMESDLGSFESSEEDSEAEQLAEEMKNLKI